MVDFRNPQELYNALESADMILLKKIFREAGSASNH